MKVYIVFLCFTDENTLNGKGCVTEKVFSSEKKAIAWKEHQEKSHPEDYTHDYLIIETHEVE